jgi:hypothetical protein
MVEPVSLSLGAIVAALVAKGVERAADDAVEGGEGMLRRLVAALRERFAGAGDEPAREALTRVQDAPDSPSRVKALAAVIDQRARDDLELRGELEALVAQARGGGVNVEKISQAAWGDQNVQAAGLVDSEVNVSYGSPPPRRSGT